ncbi:uncharacterized protein PGTG_02397 [Puccinia graminis f. sp. tritici CRL 75-36-700-3]|uniref:Uncharacterized protein n=1 Tax=Puccinia graminis f. sp. tritici (strain CRL 75-36-700-3 / race SCCL) TaxID=418459 RepID=E3JY11_PUCGT|nr:uncharacterized protein PGTG_02397 [Puccinia graminis f. sp. tritici CRL 75-36-700-3]EFP76936.1 hypothetical protein PGTG_02397 [Puccinia graminis f. sp. tritici CRL 75-36-700-3]
MSLSPAEVNAATALANMLTNNSPLSSIYSTDRHVSVGLDDGFTLPPLVEIRPSAYLQAHAGAILDVDTSTNADLGFVPLFNAAPATPVSLSSDQDGSIATEDELGPSDSEEDSRLQTLPDSSDRCRETYLQSNATLIASPTPREQFVRPTEALTSPGPEPIDYSVVIPASNGYRSPSVVSFSDLPGNGTADSPYYVNTPPPGSDAKENAADRGPFFAEVVRERTVRTARRRIKERFHDYFHILDSFPYCTAARTGERRRSARQWLYRKVMDEMDLVLADVDEVTMQLVN